jgi:hypothetical protein
MLNAGSVQFFRGNQRPPFNISFHIQELLETLGVLDVVHTVHYAKAGLLHFRGYFVIRRRRLYAISRLSNAAGAIRRWLCEKIQAVTVLFPADPGAYHTSRLRSRHWLLAGEPIASGPWVRVLLKMREVLDNIPLFFGPNGHGPALLEQEENSFAILREARVKSFHVLQEGMFVEEPCPTQHAM